MPQPGRSRSVSDAQLLDVVQTADCPVISAGEVADSVGLCDEQTRTLLNELADRDELQRCELNKKTVVYWVENR